MRAVAGAGRVNVADVTWGTRTDVDPINDSSARVVDHGSGGLDTLCSCRPKAVRKPDVSSQPDAGGNPIGARSCQPKAVGIPDVISQPDAGGNPIGAPQPHVVGNKPSTRQQTRTIRGSEERPLMHTRALPWPLRVRVPRLPRRLLLLKENLTQLWLCDVEDVIADVSVTESDKEKQRQIAASIEHQLTHNENCCMCEGCLRCKIQKRQKRK